MWSMLMLLGLTLAGPMPRRAPLRRRPAFRRPRLEALEDRWVPSTLTVTNNLDSGAGSALVRAADTHAITGKAVFDCSVDIRTGTVSSTGFCTGGVGHFTSLGHMDSLVIDPVADRGTYSGTGTVTTAQGDQVFFTFTTSWQLSTGIGTHFVTYTGGTGRFVGASGSSTSDCTITPSPTSPFIYLCHTEGSGTVILPNGREP
jgi:hypothetical protein